MASMSLPIFFLSPGVEPEYVREQICSRHKMARQVVREEKKLMNKNDGRALISRASKP